MNIFYIDDSGDLGLKDKKQPYLIFSGPILNNDNWKVINDEMQNIINKTKKKISAKIFYSLANNSYTRGNASDIANLITKKLISNDFEIHIQHLLRGDDEYMVLHHQDRVEIVKSILNLIKVNDVKIKGVIFNKDQIIGNTSIQEKDKEAVMRRCICELLANKYNDFLKETNSESLVVIDKGNSAIKSYFKPYVCSIKDIRISHEIVEYESYTSPLIQLADVCSYVINFYEKSKIPNFLKDEDKNRASELYEIIEDQIELWSLEIEEIEEIEEKEIVS